MTRFRFEGSDFKVATEDEILASSLRFGQGEYPLRDRWLFDVKQRLRKKIKVSHISDTIWVPRVPFPSDLKIMMKNSHHGTEMHCSPPLDSRNQEKDTKARDDVSLYLHCGTSNTNRPLVVSDEAVNTAITISSDNTGSLCDATKKISVCITNSDLIEANTSQIADSGLSDDISIATKDSVAEIATPSNTCCIWAEPSKSSRATHIPAAANQLDPTQHKQESTHEACCSKFIEYDQETDSDVSENISDFETATFITADEISPSESSDIEEKQDMSESSDIEEKQDNSESSDIEEKHDLSESSDIEEKQESESSLDRSWIEDVFGEGFIPPDIILEPDDGTLVNNSQVTTELFPYTSKREQKPGKDSSHFGSDECKEGPRRKRQREVWLDTDSDEEKSLADGGLWKRKSRKRLLYTRLENRPDYTNTAQKVAESNPRRVLLATAVPRTASIPTLTSSAYSGASTLSNRTDLTRSNIFVGTNKISVRITSDPPIKTQVKEQVKPTTTPEKQSLSYKKSSCLDSEVFAVPTWEQALKEIEEYRRLQVLLVYPIDASDLGTPQISEAITHCDFFKFFRAPHANFLQKQGLLKIVYTQVEESVKNIEILRRGITTYKTAHHGQDADIDNVYKFLTENDSTNTDGGWYSVCTLYIKGLASATKEGNIRQIFPQTNAIILPRDKGGQCKGHAYLSYATAVDAVATFNQFKDNPPTVVNQRIQISWFGNKYSHSEQNPNSRQMTVDTTPPSGADMKDNSSKGRIVVSKPPERASSGGSSGDVKNRILSRNPDLICVVPQDSENRGSSIKLDNKDSRKGLLTGAQRVQYQNTIKRLEGKVAKIDPAFREKCGVYSRKEIGNLQEALAKDAELRRELVIPGVPSQSHVPTQQTCTKPKYPESSRRSPERSPHCNQDINRPIREQEIPDARRVQLVNISRRQLDYWSSEMSQRSKCGIPEINSRDKNLPNEQRRDVFCQDQLEAQRESRSLSPSKQRNLKDDHASGRDHGGEHHSNVHVSEQITSPRRGLKRTGDKLESRCKVQSVGVYSPLFDGIHSSPAKNIVGRPEPDGSFWEKPCSPHERSSSPSYRSRQGRSRRSSAEPEYPASLDENNNLHSNEPKYTDVHTRFDQLSSDQRSSANVHKPDDQRSVSSSVTHENGSLLGEAGIKNLTELLKIARDLGRKGLLPHQNNHDTTRQQSLQRRFEDEKPSAQLNLVSSDQVAPKSDHIQKIIYEYMYPQRDLNRDTLDGSNTARTASSPAGSEMTMNRSRPQDLDPRPCQTSASRDSQQLTLFKQRWMNATGQELSYSGYQRMRDETSPSRLPRVECSDWAYLQKRMNASQFLEYRQNWYKAYVRQLNSTDTYGQVPNRIPF